MRRRHISHREAHFRKQILVIGGGILLLVFFLGFFGLNSIIAVSVWVGDRLSGGKAQPSAQDGGFFGTIFVDSVPAATNSANIIVSGTTSNFETVEITLNGSKTITAKVMSQDFFTEKVGPLSVGNNTIEVAGVSTKHRARKAAAPITVVYKNTKPKLEIIEPADGSRVSSDEVTVRGTTDPGVTVEIDGLPAVVTANGSFRETVRLDEGENTIAISAVDEAMNVQKLELKVIYEREK